MLVSVTGPSNRKCSDCKKSYLSSGLTWSALTRTAQASTLHYSHAISANTARSVQVFCQKSNLIWDSWANEIIEGYRTRWFACKPGSMINSRDLIVSGVFSDQHGNGQLPSSPDLLLTLYHVIPLNCLEGDFWPAQYHATALQWYFVSNKKSTACLNSPAIYLQCVLGGSGPLQ